MFTLAECFVVGFTRFSPRLDPSIAKKKLHQKNLHSSTYFCYLAVFSVFILAAMTSKLSNALDSLWYNFTFTFFSIMIFLHVNWCLIHRSIP